MRDLKFRDKKNKKNNRKGPRKANNRVSGLI